MSNIFHINLSRLKNLRGVLHENHVMVPYTSWRVGGPAQYFYQPADLADLVNFLQQIAYDIPITWLGAATNVLIRDTGIAGVVIYVRGCLNNLHFQLSEVGTTTPFAIVRAEAGVYCSRILQQGINFGLGKTVFLSGIPGTVGGALAMNAGAYGDEIWNYVNTVEVINRCGDIIKKDATSFRASYREVVGLKANEWFVAGELRFPAALSQNVSIQDEKEGIDQVALIKQRVRDLLQKRGASQPLNTFNCGSVFCNPTGDYAARLIEACGLKGKTIGGARVSEKHANFIINCGSATAAEIEALISHIIETVAKRFGVELKTEIKILG